MAEVGLLAPDARVELVEGEIIDMTPPGSRHGYVVDQLNRLLVMACGERAVVRVRGAVRLSNITELQPHLALLRPAGRSYAARQPLGPDTFLVIEVSNSSLRYDRQIKIPLYARHGVPEAWIVDLPGDRIHFFRSLEGEGYADVSSAAQPGIERVSAMPGLQVDLTDLLAV
jgi:Uma2 family endonuclease